MIGLVVLMGLPASGKTTLCRALDRWQHSPSNKDGAVLVLHVELDRVLPSPVHLLPTDSDNASWRAQRRMLLNRVGALLASLSNGATTTTELRTPFDALKLDVALIGRLAAARQVLVLVDDNMYYSSMRHEVHHLSRKCGTPIVLVHLDERVDVARDRNATRPSEHVVPADVFERMSTKFEPPSTNKAWDQSLVATAMPLTLEQLDDKFVQTVLSAITTGLDADVKRLGAQKQLQEQRDQLEGLKDADRAKTDASLVHQLDIHLRRKLGELIQQFQLQQQRQQRQEQVGGEQEDQQQQQQDMLTDIAAVATDLQVERKLILETVRLNRLTPDSYDAVRVWAEAKLERYLTYEMHLSGPFH